MKNTITVVVTLMMGLASSAVAQNAPKDFFVSKCAICHGADGSAKTPMGKNLKIRDFHSPDVQKQSDADLKTVITKGKGKMPAFGGKLSGEQIDQLVSYVRDMGKQKQVASGQ